MPTLASELEIVAAGGDYAVRFHLRNTGAAPIAVRYFTPYIDFDLEVYDGEQRVPLAQPGFDGAARPVELKVAPGESGNLETPVRLHFDPHMPPAGGPNPLRWTIRKEAGPVRLRAMPRVQGATVTPCEATLAPEAT